VRLRRSARIAGAAGAITLALLLAAGSRAATQGVRGAIPNLVGTWQIVTHVRGGISGRGTTHGTIQITSFNRHTGKFAGTGTEALSDVFFRISGSVEGRSILMTVSGGGDTAHDRGTIRADGSITGTLNDSYGSKGRWTMKRQLVVVTKTGWGVDHSGPNSSSYGIGLKLVNRSKRDAYQITVTLVEQGGGNGNLSGYQFFIATIPARHSFVIGDNHGNIGSTHFTRIGATIQVGYMEPHNRGEERLPAVSGVQLDRKNYAVNAVITNRSQLPLNLQSANAYAVLYNSAGRIIGGGNALSLWDGIGPTTLKPGAHQHVSISVDGKMSRVTHVEVSASQ
jgi:hypothetical protein